MQHPVIYPSKYTIHGQLPCVIRRNRYLTIKQFTDVSAVFEQSGFRSSKIEILSENLCRLAKDKSLKIF
jgi:hypothetical protein